MFPAVSVTCKIANEDLQSLVCYMLYFHCCCCVTSLLQEANIKACFLIFRFSSPDSFFFQIYYYQLLFGLKTPSTMKFLLMDFDRVLLKRTSHHQKQGKKRPEKLRFLYNFSLLSRSFCFVHFISFSSLQRYLRKNPCFFYQNLHL